MWGREATKSRSDPTFEAAAVRGLMDGSSILQPCWNDCCRHGGAQQLPKVAKIFVATIGTALADFVFRRGGTNRWIKYVGLPPWRYQSLQQIFWPLRHGKDLIFGTDDCSAFSVCRVSGCQVVCSFREPSWGPIETLVGPSWDPLGALLEPFWALLGASWALLGPLGSLLGALWGRVGAKLAKNQGGAN